MLLYHVTSVSRVEHILKQGLLIGTERGRHGPWIGNWADEAYQDRPVFVSYEPWLLLSRGHSVLLEIDGDGLRLTADLVSLTTECGARVDRRNRGLYWYEDFPPELLQFASEPGLVTFKKLLGSAAETCIEMTRTAACCRSISPERIRLLDWEEAYSIAGERASFTLCS